MYTYQTKVQLHHTDAAGLLFFANQFVFFHDAYEALMEDAGFSFRSVFAEGKHLFPIVHARGDYKKTLYSGEVLEIQVTLIKTGKSSFSLGYSLFRPDGEKVGFGETVHVTMNPETREKMEIPPLLKEKLRAICG